LNRRDAETPREISPITMFKQHADLHPRLQQLPGVVQGRFAETQARIDGTGDEVLDYRHAVKRYHGCRQIVIEGGDHAFRDFGEYLDTVLEFCGVSALHR
jgi:hypothetical protein